MTRQPEQWLDFDAYLAIEEQSEQKHEYDEGSLTAMAGATA